MPVERRQIAPKTWEYYNYGDEPQTAPPTVDEPATNATPSQNMFEEMQQKAGFAPAAPSQEAQRRMWRSQLKNFDETLRKGDPRRSIDDQIQGVQELLDSGAVWLDDDGNVFSALERHPGGEKGNRRMLDAMRTWGDWYRDQIAAGEDLPPPQKHYQEMIQKQMEREEMDWNRIKVGIGNAQTP